MSFYGEKWVFGQRCDIFGPETWSVICQLLDRMAWPVICSFLGGGEGVDFFFGVKCLMCALLGSFFFDFPSSCPRWPGSPAHCFLTAHFSRPSRSPACLCHLIPSPCDDRFATRYCDQTRSQRPTSETDPAPARHNAPRRLLVKVRVGLCRAFDLPLNLPCINTFIPFSLWFFYDTSFGIF